MKKYLIIFLAAWVLVLGYSPRGHCSADPNDRGVPDTMYVEPWPDDLVWSGGAGPYPVRVPIYVTTDVADVWDSIPAFVIPLCYTNSNPSVYCSLSWWWNTVDMYPSSGLDRSIFRHLPSMDNPLVHNRMMDLAQAGSGEAWDFRFLDLDGISHFWLALMSSAGYLDREWWGGSRILLATVTLRLEDSATVCLDTCFWPPSSRLAFVTRPYGGGPAMTKIPRPGIHEADDFNTCFTFEPPDPVDCNRSFSDPNLVACPLGDIPFRVYLRDVYGNPVAGYSNAWLDFSGCSGITPCAGETSWPLVYPDGPSDANGMLTFRVNAGGCDNSHYVQVKSRCGLIQNRLKPIRTVDPDGDLVVRVSDWHGIGVDPCNDFNCNGEVNYWDLDFFREHLTHGCVQDPCLLLSQELTVTPDTLLPVGGVHDVRLFVQNYNAQPCSGRADFFRAGFGAGTTLQWFAGRDLPRKLTQGDTCSVRADFVVPGTGSGYILSELSTGCCAHTVDAIFNFTERVCPAELMVYVFPLHLPTVPAYIETLAYMPETLGWYWFLYSTGGMPDSIAIVTPATSPLGVTGGVTLYFYDYSWNLLGHRTCEVRITLNSGDVTADCIVNIGDVVALLNYLFKGGPAPNPIRAGDVNCDCILTLSDAIYMLNYLFKAGPPPASSESCECGYKEWFPR